VCWFTWVEDFCFCCCCVAFNVVWSFVISMMHGIGWQDIFNDVVFVVLYRMLLRFCCRSHREIIIIFSPMQLVSRFLHVLVV